MRSSGRQNERQVMIRIIKLLFSFADMAERAAYRSILVRTFLLTLFRIAEPVARRYVLRYDGNTLKIPEPLRGEGISGRAEALHLAWLFRLFAMMLTNLMAWRDLGRIDSPSYDTPTTRLPIPLTFNPSIQQMPARGPPSPACANHRPVETDDTFVAGFVTAPARRFATMLPARKIQQNSLKTAP